MAPSIEHRRRDMTVTLAAEVTLGRAQEHLREADQWLAVDGESDRPVGKLVEENSTGPLRLGFGAWRDVLLGCRFRNGAGQTITAGGRTMKNVAGYDLTKLMVGQHGILGQVVSITVRTYRRPFGAILLRLEPDRQRLESLLRSPLRPQWAVLAPEGLLCGYLADQATLVHYAQALAALRPLAMDLRSLQEDTVDRQRLWSPPAPAGAIRFRVSVPPNRIGEVVSAAGLQQWAADAAHGIVVGVVSPDEAAAPARMREAALGLGGSIVLRRDGALVDFSVASETERRLLRQLKKAFDPEGKLTPLPSSIDPRDTP